MPLRYGKFQKYRLLRDSFKRVKKHLTTDEVCGTFALKSELADKNNFVLGRFTSLRKRVTSKPMACTKCFREYGTGVIQTIWNCLNKAQPMKLHMLGETWAAHAFKHNVLQFTPK